MARIPDNEIEQIKANISLRRLVESSGVILKSHGNDLVGLCPFHDDKTPSLVITPAKNLWHCLGACQQGGSVIDWVMKQKNISFRHAVELLRQDLSPLAASLSTPVEQVVLPPLFKEGERAATLKRVVGFYHATLKASPEALDYLMKRGIQHSEAIDYFQLGYANRRLAYRLPPSINKTGSDMRNHLQEIGIMRLSGHEHFTGSLVIPVFDENGNVVEMYGRKLLGNRLRKGTPIHTYLPGPHKGVWNMAAFKASDEIILCEALIDALTFWCAGFRNVTASYGIAGFTKDHLNALKNHHIKKVYIAYDRDEAGNCAAEKLSQELMAEGIDCFRVLFPKGMDANDYACQVKPADKSLDLVIRKAEWLGNGKKNVVVTEDIMPINEPLVDASIAVTEVKPIVDIEDQPIIPTVLLNETLRDTEMTDQQISINIDNRRYRVRGLSKNLSYEQLKINLLIQKDEHFYVDTLDIYSARLRASFIKQAALELGLTEEIIKQDLGKVLLKLEELQDAQIKGELEHKTQLPKMTDNELKAALTFLKSPNLIEQILKDFDCLGVVGETTNKLVSYLAAVSRKLDKPLAVMVQSSSAAGKSSLMEAVLQLMPVEERVQYSAMTGQSLFYMGEQDLKHKILAIAEEAGATQTAYALKLLQSEGEVSIASTGKNATTGNLETQVYRVEGPVMLFSTTTAIDIDEELMNRCLVLSVDESREQTQAIHAAQRQKRTLLGLRAKQQKQLLVTLHQNAQRLLRSVAVLNPYADRLTFLDAKTRTRRDHEKYLTLIDAIALLHQYQRPLKKDKHQGQVTEYIGVTLDDIAIANELAHEVLGKTLDELPPQTRRLLHLIQAMVQENAKMTGIKQQDYRFSRKDIRAFTGLSDGQLKIHCHRLEELEYIVNHGGKRGKPMCYELIYDGTLDENTPHLMGLINIVHLKQSYDDEKSGQNDKKSPSSQPQVSPKLGGCQDDEIKENCDKLLTKSLFLPLVAKNEPLAKANGIASHRSDGST
jgi:DNA primase